MNDILKGSLLKAAARGLHLQSTPGRRSDCVWNRKANKRTRKDTYPLPLIDEVQDCLSGATVFTSVWVLASTSGPKGPREDRIFTWSWNGVVPVHKDALWLMWGTQHIPETHECGDARTAICHHLHR